MAESVLVFIFKLIYLTESGDDDGWGSGTSAAGAPKSGGEEGVGEEARVVSSAGRMECVHGVPQVWRGWPHGQGVSHWRKWRQQVQELPQGLFLVYKL